MMHARRGEVRPRIDREIQAEGVVASVCLAVLLALAMGAVVGVAIAHTVLGGP